MSAPARRSLRLESFLFSLSWGSSRYRCLSRCHLCDMAMLIACEPCRQQKRKCDRQSPSCARCTKQSRRCFYPPHSLTTENSADDLYVVVSAQLYRAWAVHSPDLPKSYPIPARWYMPRLVKQFCEGLGVSGLPRINVHSTASYTMRHWMQGALSEPCLFHATLYAGSSHFDHLEGKSQSWLTLYHQNEVIRLLNQRLSDMKSAADDRTILAVIPLAMFANIHGDRGPADIHLAGLRQLVDIRGGRDKLGYDGIVSGVIQMNNIMYHVMFDLGPTSSTLGPPPVGLEDRILRSSEALSVPGRQNIINMFEHLREFKLGCQTTANNPPESHEYSKSTRKQDDPFFHCCYLAVTIFSLIVVQSHDPGASIKIEFLASELQASLGLTNAEVWITQMPALFSWVCMTGAAASHDAKLRIWFYFHQASAVRVLDFKTGPAYLDELWAHFYWLRMMRLRRVTEL